MTAPKDFEEVIRKRIEQLNKDKKSKPIVTKPPKLSEASVEPPVDDEGVDKGEASKKALKCKRKRMRGYMSKQGRKRG